MTNPSRNPGPRRWRDWHHLVLMFVFMAVFAAALFYLFMHVDFVPNQASEQRVLIDRFLQILFAIASLFFAGIVTVLGYAVIFFRGRPGDEMDSRPIQGSLPLEITWTIIPLIIVVVLSIYGAHVLDQMSSVSTNASTTQTVYSLGAFVPREVPPSKDGVGGVALASANKTAQPPLVVNVDAARFAWSFSYPQYAIGTTYSLEVPVDRPVIFHIKSEDVIHSFWVQAWGPKQDAVPGISPDLLITPIKTGQFLVQCNQLCGFGHSDMTAPVYVVTESEFNQWVQQQKKTPAATPTPTAPINLTAQNDAFSTANITVNAGSAVTINFTNGDSGEPHNLSVYTNSSANDIIFKGKTILGPGSISYTFAAPVTPGTYYFRDDLRPGAMHGSFVVK